ncbi:MAG: DNA polymerase I [Gammaproteobacteria bacterium]|nr:DNA polymerase I [Gammaproteobacteria bacterium]
MSQAQGNATDGVADTAVATAAEGVSDPPLLLVDGSSYLFRAFHAMPNLSTSDGIPTGAIFGVVNMLRKLCADFEGSPVAVVFDAGGKSFRNDIYPEYKANRPPMPDELRQQVQPIHDIIDAMGMPLLVVPDVEADDVIGTLAEQAAALKRRIVISTSDKDMAQLVGEHVTLVNTMSETAMDRDGVFEKYGVHPERIVDYLALMGDSVDNIPGVPNVGPKTAAKWLASFGSLDDVIERADEVRGKVGENLRASLDALPVSKRLATIRRDVELSVAIGDLAPRPVDEERLRSLFEKYEFKAWIEELGGSLGQRPAEGDYACVTTGEELDDLVGRIRAAGSCSLAVVTRRGNRADAEVAGIAFAEAPGEAAYVPLGLDLTSGDHLSLAEATDCLKPLLEDARIAKAGHNMKRAKRVLARCGMDLRGIAHDTMLESYVLDSVGTRRHNLDDLVEKQVGLGTTRYEDVAGRGAKQIDFALVPPKAATAHAAGAADAALRLHDVLWPRLSSIAPLKSLYEKVELPLLSVLSRVEQAGTLVDAGLLADQSRELAGRMAHLAEQAFEQAGKQFNLGSPKQLREILYDRLELHRHLRTPGTSRTQTGQRSTAEHVLAELALHHPLPQIILDYRQVSKLRSTYTDTLPKQISQRTGRIHTSYEQAVAATGRLSSQDPNLQNIPIRTDEGRRIRAAFVAPPGHKLVAADYSQIELRIMAHLSRDAGLLNAFENRLDIHRATASEVFGSPVSDVTDGQRRSAKAINFGLIYGMSAFGLARQLGIERKLAQEYIDLYFARYPGVRDYMERIRAEAREQGFVETVFGRRLYLPDINARQVPRRQAAERTAINAPMQGTAADIIKRAMISVDAWLAQADHDARMIMQVHDELVMEVAEDDVEAVVEGVTERMTAAADLSVDLVVDAGVGDNWDQAH